MDDLIIFFIWSLIVFSLTNLLVVSKIFYPLRIWLTYKKLQEVRDDAGTVRYEGTPRKIQFFSAMIHCPMCLGFWIGILASLFIISPTELVTLGDYFYVNTFADGLLGSLMSWVYYLMLGKHQINS